MEKHYLGDGVFVEMNDETLICTLTSQRELITGVPLDKIELTPEALDALNRFLQTWFTTRQTRKGG